MVLSWAAAPVFAAPLPPAPVPNAPGAAGVQASQAPGPAAPALQASGSPGSPPLRAVLVSLRPGYGPPGGVQLRWSVPSRSWWSAGLDFNPAQGAVQSAWLRRQWRLVPDVLAQLGLEGGYQLEAGPGSSSPTGPWLGLYVGQQWQGGRLLAEIGTSLRLPPEAAHRVWWETVLALGFTW